MFNRVNINRCGARHIFTLDIFQFQYSLIFVVKTWLIEYCNTKIFLGPIWFGHLQEGIYLADGGDVVGNERLHLGIEFNFLRLVALDVLEHLLELLRNGKVRVLIGVVGTGHLLLVVFVVFLVLLLPLGRHLLLQVLLSCLLLLFLRL